MSLSIRFIILSLLFITIIVIIIVTQGSVTYIPSEAVHGYQHFDNKSFGGKTIGDVHMNTRAECAGQCDDSVVCAGFGYNKTTGECHLKQSCTNPSVDGFSYYERK